MNKNDVEKVVADLKDTINETREINRAKAQERALADKPVDTALETKLYADAQSAMKEGRAITLAGTGDVSVAHSLVKGLQDKMDVLKRFSISTGGKANEIIPVWKTDLGEFAPVAEGGTFSGDEGAMGTVNLQPYAFAKQIKLTDETLRLSAVNFETELKDLINKSLGKTILNQIFKGTGSSGQFKSILDGAVESEASTWNASALHKFVLETVATKSDTAEIWMNPAQYASLADGTGNKDRFLIEQILNKNIEGHDIVISAYVPNFVHAVAFEPSNYGIGVADELRIQEKAVAGSLVHTYDCSAYLCGAPIIPTDVFKLVPARM